MNWPINMMLGVLKHFHQMDYNGLIYKTIPNMFKLVKSDKKMPNCEFKVYIHDTVEFELDNSILMLSVVMKSAIVRLGQWDNHIECNCNYTNDLFDKSLQLSLIYNISHEKQSKIIKLFTRVSISRNKLYYHAKKNHGEFIKNENEIVDNIIKNQKIEFIVPIIFVNVYWCLFTQITIISIYWYFISNWSINVFK